ncbi:c-type cytochrome [Paenibacillus marinisediminis]
MAHKPSSNEKIVYVGDSRVKKKSGTTPLPVDYSAYPGKSEAFIPNFLLKEWMVGVVALVAILVLTISEPAPLGYPADPNANFIPIPDWYFLFLYQLLKFPYTSGDYTVLGTMVIPGLAFGGLVLAPFLDTGKERRFYKRPIATSLMLVSLIAIIALTRIAWSGYQAELKELNIVPEHIEREEKARQAAEEGKETGQPKKNKAVVALVEPEDPALELMKKAQCLACHADDLKGTSNGPSLRGVGDRKSQDEILAFLHEGPMKPMYESALKNGVTEEEIVKITEWLAKQKAAE